MRRNVETIIKYGKKFGWTYENSILRYEPQKLGLSQVETKWNLLDDTSKEGLQLKRAIISEGKRELREAIRNVNRRKKILSGVQSAYEENAVEILKRQRKRLSEKEGKEKLLELENIYRESTEGAYRQTPLERASLKGIQKKAELAVDRLNKAFQSPNYLAKVGNATPQTLNVLKQLVAWFGTDIDIDKILEQNVSKYGDPYKAIEQTFIEVNEYIDAEIKEMPKNKLEQLLQSDYVRDTLIVLGLLNVPGEY